MKLGYFSILSLSYSINYKNHILNVIGILIFYLMYFHFLSQFFLVKFFLYYYYFDFGLIIYFIVLIIMINYKKIQKCKISILKINTYK